MTKEDLHCPSINNQLLYYLNIDNSQVCFLDLFLYFINVLVKLLKFKKKQFVFYFKNALVYVNSYWPKRERKEV